MTKQTKCKTGTELPIIGAPPGNSPEQKKRGRGRTRALVLIVVHLVILAHILHYYFAGRTVSPLEPSESMYTLELGHVNAGAVLFLLAIVSTVIFGRFFCGWGCHVVALQDLCGHFLRRFGLRPKPFRSRLLVLIPYALAFYMFFWPTVKRLWWGIERPPFSNHLMTERFWATFPGVAVSILTFVVCGGLIVYLLGNKGFCTYACPYGALFSISDRLAFGRIRVTDACHQCGLCTATCTSNVQVHAEVRDFGMVVDTGCMKCMDCVSVCPNEALYFGLTGSVSATDAGRALPVVDVGKSAKKEYDYSLAEELVGLLVAGVTVFALRELYDIVPLLLSVAVAAITAFSALQLIKSFRKRDRRIQNFQLKRNGRFTRTGFLFLALAAGWLVFIGHSSIVQYHRYQGREQLNRIYRSWRLDHLNLVNVAWDDLMNGNAQANLTEKDHAIIDQAFRGYQKSDEWSLLNVREVKLGLAVSKILKRDMADVESYLRDAYRCDPKGVRDILRDFLVLQGRADQAAEIQ